MSIDQIAGIIEAEASVLSLDAKIAVGQCISDNRFDINAFTTPSRDPSPESYKAANLVIHHGAKRFKNAKILQFRSFKKYGLNGIPDWTKLHNSVPADLIYLGKDGEGEWGHYYFGRYTEMSKPFKMLVICGHGRNMDGSYDPGAIGCGYEEATLTRELGRLVKHACDENNVDCVVADTSKNYYSFFKHGNKYDFTPYNYVLEIHFNAAVKTDMTGDGSIKGTMVYIDQDEKGHSVEDKILQNLYSLGSKKAWSGVVITQWQYTNGLMVQRHVREQGVSETVLETCFITDKDDMNWYHSKKLAIANAIVEGIIDGFGLKEEPKSYAYVGKGIASAKALEDMNVRCDPSVHDTVIGIVRAGQDVEVLERLDNGWYKIVWPGVGRGYAYTSNVLGKYYREY